MTCDLQKGSMLKRTAAFLLDGILLVIVITGVAWLLSAVLQYQSYVDTFDAGYEKYQKEYGVEFSITQEDYDALTPEQQKNFDDATKALNEDEAVLHAYSMMTSLALLICTVSILAAFLILEFAVPLKLGNGQTVGKRIFGLAVMRMDGVKVGSTVMFVRTLLGKATLETMVPVMILIMILFAQLGMFGTVLLGLIGLLQIILVIATRTNSVIHDLLANTVVVDMASQRIFESDLELLAYKEQKQAEKAARQTY